MHIYIIPFRVNFDCDDQKLRFRSSGGRALVWGAEPKQAPPPPPFLGRRAQAGAD